MISKLRIIMSIIGCIVLPAAITCDQGVAAALTAPESVEETEATTEAIIEETLQESSSVLVFWETTAEPSTEEETKLTAGSSEESLFLDPETEEETYFIEDAALGPRGYFSVPDLGIAVPLYSVYDSAMDHPGAAGLSRGKLVLDHVSQDNFSLLETAEVGMKAYLARNDGSVKLLSCSYSGLGYFDGESYCLADGSPVKEHKEYAALTCHDWPGIWVTLWAEEKS